MGLLKCKDSNNRNLAGPQTIRNHKSTRIPSIRQGTILIRTPWTRRKTKLVRRLDGWIRPESHIVMLKPGQPKKFRKGNLALVSPPTPTQPSLPDILAIWSEPVPSSKGPKVIGSLHKNDLVLILDIRNIDQYIQYSKIFSTHRNTVGWVNSKFLVKVQKWCHVHPTSVPVIWSSSPTSLLNTTRKELGSSSTAAFHIRTVTNMPSSLTEEKNS